MADNVETLEFVAKLAGERGELKAQYEHKMSEVEKLQKEIAEMNKLIETLQQRIAELEGEREDAAKKDAVIAEREKRITDQDKRIASQEERISELEMLVQQVSGQTTVVVNNFFMLSIDKTVSYVSTLDNNGRLFVGHFIHHTMPDGTPLSVIAQVDEMTRLQGSQEERLAVAIEEIAKQPTTQNIYGDKNEFNAASTQMKVTVPDGADAADIASRIADRQQARLEDIRE